MLFGDIVQQTPVPTPPVVGADLVSAHVQLNDAGKMTETIYQQIIASYPDIESDKHVIMPNHIHCILTISDKRADTRSAPTGDGDAAGDS